ncbi:helix-turn-helix domain-containing protein [Fontibacillus sp. BL9]|uniref:helix-turn-helix domain-containing protein n=1 Tax=Fontibacillus sp. BL9 TaxID=3389971 RepID=UPI00397DAA78
MKVLIVDDEVIIRTGLSTVIPWAEHGFTVLEPAASAEEALERIPLELPEIIITDIRMTGLSGLDLAHEVKLRFPEMELIIITGFDDFVYVQQALREGVGDYLLKTSRPNEILQAAEQAGQRLEERRRLNEMGTAHKRLANQSYLRNLLNNGPGFASGSGLEDQQAGEELSRRYPDLRLSGKGQELQVWLLSVEQRPAGRGEAEEVRSPDAQPEDIGTLLAARLPCEWLPWGDGLLLLVRMEGNHDGWCPVESAIAAAEQSLGCRISAACGQPALGVGDLRRAVETAEEAASYRWLLHPKRRIRYEHVRHRKGCRIICSQEEENELSLLLRGGAHDDLRAWIDSQLEWIRLDGQATPGTLRAYAHSLAVAGHRWLERAAASISYGYSFSDFEEEFDLNRLAQHPEVVLHCHLETIMHAYKRMVEGISPVQSAIAYIYDHLGQSLSLNQVARHVHMNPNYFSAMFKRETGQNYIEFVTRMKMQKAMAMLRETPAKVSEVAGDIGYGDLKYFNRLFKKFTGLTPSEYREKSERSENRPAID